MFILLTLNKWMLAELNPQSRIYVELLWDVRKNVRNLKKLFTS